MPEPALGAINRWIVPPGSILQLKDGDHGREEDGRVGVQFLTGIRDIFRWYEGLRPYLAEGEWEFLMPRTAVDIYGQSMGICAAAYSLCETTTRDNVVKEYRSSEAPSSSSREAPPDWYVDVAFDQRAAYRRAEAPWNTWLAQALYGDPNFPKDWTGKANFNRWQDTPPCLCCGWDLEVHRKMLIDRSPADRAEQLRGVAALVNPA